MTLVELFNMIGEHIYDNPEAGDKQVKLEMLIDSGLAQDDVASIRDGLEADNPTVILSTEAL
jgi:hypothetical protein